MINKHGSQTCVTECPCVATFAVTVGVSCVGDLAAAMFAVQTAAGVEQLPLLVAQRTAVALGTIAAVRFVVQRDASAMDTSIDTRRPF